MTDEADGVSETGLQAGWWWFSDGDADLGFPAGCWFFFSWPA